MELKQTIQCETRVSAGLDEHGALTLKCFASAEYAPGRTTTAEVNVIPRELSEAVRAALQAVLIHSTAELGNRIGRAIHKSAEVAAAQGEI